MGFVTFIGTKMFSQRIKLPSNIFSKYIHFYMQVCVHGLMHTKAILSAYFILSTITPVLFLNFSLDEIRVLSYYTMLITLEDRTKLSELANIKVNKAGRK